MDQALWWLIALGAVVWVAIFAAAKMSATKTAGLRAAARREAMEMLLNAQMEQVAEDEAREPPLPSLSLLETLRQQVATFRIKRDAEGRFGAVTSPGLSSSRQSKAEREKA